MKKIIDWIKEFIKKNIIDKDPCCNNKLPGRYVKKGYFEDKRIYERNPDTNVIRSRKLGDYGNGKIEKKLSPKKKKGRPKKKK